MSVLSPIPSQPSTATPVPWSLNDIVQRSNSGPPVSEQAARLLAVIGMAGIAMIHILDAPDTFGGARYIFWLYIAIIVGAIPSSLLLVQWRSRWAWAGPALLAAGPLVGYLVSRSVGLPGDGQDVGNWLDSLGLASMFVELAVLGLSLARLGFWRGRERRGAGRARLTAPAVTSPPTRIGDDGAMQPIEAAVFDIGGVLLDWNPRYLYRELFDDEDSMERFLAEVCTIEWHVAHDRGIPFAQSCAALAERHPEQAKLIWAWGRRSEEMIGGPIDGTVQILRDLLDAGVPCYALTNMEAETYPVRRERYEFLRWFRGTVVSSHEGVTKPDPEIFRRLLERFSLTAATTLLIDDSAANVETARRLGMQALQFRSPGQARSFLETAGLLASVADRRRA